MLNTLNRTAWCQALKPFCHLCNPPLCLRRAGLAKKPIILCLFNAYFALPAYILILIEIHRYTRIHTDTDASIDDDDMHSAHFDCVCFCITISFACHSVCAFLCVAPKYNAEFWKKKNTHRYPIPVRNRLVVLYIRRPLSAMSQKTQQHIPRFYRITITQNTQHTYSVV